MVDLIIKNGKIITSSDIYEADIVVNNEKIECITKDTDGYKAHKIIDAKNKYILPGLIEPHMHVEAPFMGCDGVLDFYTASKAAAYGGVTTFMDFTNTFKGDSVYEKVVERKEEMSKSAIDFSMHAKVVEVTDKLMEELPKIVDYGCNSIKLFMTYKKAGVMIEGEDILRLLLESKEHGMIIGVHAEDNNIAEFNDEVFRKSNNVGWEQFPISKPPICEGIATYTAIKYAEYADAKLYIFHLTSEEALNHVISARERGVKVTAETCPHYLTLTKDCYDR